MQRNIQEHNIVLINVNVHNVTKVRLKMSLLAEFEEASKSGPEGFCLVSSSFPEDKSKLDKNSVNEIALKCSKNKVHYGFDKGSSSCKTVNNIQRKIEETFRAIGAFFIFFPNRHSTLITSLLEGLLSNNSLNLMQANKKVINLLYIN